MQWVPNWLGKVGLIPELEKVVLAAAWAPFFSFSVLAPSASFVETVERSASFSVAVVMSPFAP